MKKILAVAAMVVATLAVSGCDDYTSNCRRVETGDMVLPRHCVRGETGYEWIKAPSSPSATPSEAVVPAA